MLRRGIEQVRGVREGLGRRMKKIWLALKELKWLL